MHDEYKIKPEVNFWPIASMAAHVRRSYKSIERPAMELRTKIINSHRQGRSLMCTTITS